MVLNYLDSSVLGSLLIVLMKQLAHCFPLIPIVLRICHSSLFFYQVLCRRTHTIPHIPTVFANAQRNLHSGLQRRGTHNL